MMHVLRTAERRTRRPVLAYWPGMALLMVLLPLAAWGQGGAEPELIDRIVAIVDEEAILQSDLDNALESYRLELEYSGQEAPPVTAELRREILDHLVESKLLIAAAKLDGMSVDDDAIRDGVDQTVQDLQERFGSPEVLIRELGRAGMTLEDFRARKFDQLRNQQYLRLVQGKFIRPKVEVLENQVKEYYLEHLEEMPAEPDSFTLGNILIAVQPGEEVRKVIQAKMARIQEALAAGGAFADVAREFSEGPNAVRGGVLGEVAPGDLFDPNLERAVFELEPGQVSEPVISSRGVHLLRVEAVQANGRRALSQIFLPMQVDQENIDLAKEQIEAARQRLEDGESFQLVASEVSQDPASASRGGELGTFSFDDLSAPFQSVLADAQTGQLTEAVLTQAGWYLFLVHERIPGHMFTFVELEDQLRIHVENLEMEEAMLEYIEGLKDRFFVDLKE